MKNGIVHTTSSYQIYPGKKVDCRFSPYFISPIVAGINSKTSEPYICGFDNIG
jgi:20S proteasome alpha/beta subunit